MAGIDLDDAVLAAAAQDAQLAFQEWTSGQQQPALDRVRSHADRGEAWAVGFYVWLRMQQGLAGYEEAIPYARQAQLLGMPWVCTNLINNMIANVPSAPQLLEPAFSLLADVDASALVAWGLDPIGQGWNMLAQNRPDLAVRLMSVTARFPPGQESWDSLVAQGRAQANELQNVLNRARMAEADVRTAANEGLEAIAKQRDDLQTKALQAELLISSVNSGAVNALFDHEATQNAKESKTAWGWGIAILVVAACVAILPLVLHYVGRGPDYSNSGLLGAHAASTIALGTVAGVLLARARGRDVARQKARDLSTAMGTMISYSNQIQDESQKQAFMLTMGQLVLQAHLRAESGGGKSGASDESLVGSLALLNAMRNQASGS